MSIKSDILAVLAGETPERVPWNIHHHLLPQGELERAMRGRGLGIVEKSVHPYRAVSRRVSVEERQTFEEERRTLYITHHTPVGDLHSKKVIGPDGSPWVIEYPVKEVGDFRILEYISEDTDYHSNDPEIRARQKTLGEDGVVLCRMMRSPLQRLLIEWMGRRHWHPLATLDRAPGVLRWLGYTLLVWLIIVEGTSVTGAFIYFQF